MERNLSSTIIDVIKINKDAYVLIVPNKLIFLFDATEDDVRAIIEEEQNNIYDLEAQSCVDASFEAELTLIPTLDCNLRCIYCYARGGDDKIYMSKEVAKAAIDAIRKISDAQVLSLHFAGGGEPFVNFPVMDFAVQYARQLFRQVNVAVVTNGIFGREQLEWIVENNVFVRISCDGVAHDYQRPFPDGSPSRTIVEANIKNLVNLNVEFMVQWVITSINVQSMVESVDYFADLGVKILKPEPAHISETCRGSKELVPSPEEFAHNFIEMLKHIVAKDLSLKIDTSYLSRPTVGYYCGVYGANLMITPNGDITACIEITRRSEPLSDVMLYGRLLVDQAKFVFNDTALAKLRLLHFANYSTCKQCPLRLICKGGCPMQNIWECGFSLTRSKYTCQLAKLIIPRVFSLIVEDLRYSEIVFDDFDVC